VELKDIQNGEIPVNPF